MSQKRNFEVLKIFTFDKNDKGGKYGGAQILYGWMGVCMRGMVGWMDGCMGRTAKGMGARFCGGEHHYPKKCAKKRHRLF